jgi:hypothetical protein
VPDDRLDRNGELPPADHVVRYCGDKKLRPSDGRPTAAAFFPDGDGYTSVFWLEYGRVEDADEKWADLRRRMTESRITLRSKGKLASLCVGPLKGEVMAKYRRALRVAHLPNPDDGGPPVDPAHAGIYGLLPGEQDLDLADFIAEMVDELRSAKL